ncbi:MAG: type III pantothenate kinase [Flavobacteriales bacterium]|nr:type III pantothenate kinase [Flavobacteriales bacterium]
MAPAFGGGKDRIFVQTMTSPLHDLVLDAGNTRMKAALFHGGGTLRWTTLANGDLAGLRAWAGERSVQSIALGSVAAPDPAFEAALGEWAPLTVLSGTSPAPVRNAYGSPLTLGVDRLANAMGAWSLFPQRAVIAVDLGTCITYDAVDASGTYRGGLIAPGMTMRARAMNAYSARLPLVRPEAVPALLGTDTTGSLLAGVHHGVRAELVTLLHDLGHEMPGAAVVLTGGDALRFSRALKSGIFADPLLTLRGLHAILQHHRHLGIAPSGPPAGDPRNGPVGR